MKKSQISFKIKNEKNYDSIWFVGGSISLKDLKSKIKEKLQDKSAGPSKEKDKDKTKEDILVYDELTKQLITDDSTLIASDKKVIIERVLSSLPQPTTTYRSFNGSGSGGGGVVIKHDKPEFICKLCKNQFNNPTLTRCCGETACDTCLDKSIKQKSECPFCKKKVLPTSFKAGPNVTLQKMMQSAAQAKPAYPSMPPSYHYGYQPPTSSVILDYKQPPFKEVEKYLSGAKYFIIKSSNVDNIEHSIKHSEWATTKINETKLNNAFQRSKNVILIFSVNKSSQFQGYARMESLSTNKMNNWQGQESIKLGGTFKVLWLRICNVNFSRVSHLKNRFNNNEPIKKSRDTQEIPEDIGFEICKMFEVPDKDNNYYPIQEDRRRYMYSYSGGSNIATAGTPLTPVASSPREMKGIEARSSDSASPSETKVLTPNRYADESSERGEEVKKPAPEEKKKVEEKIDLLADLDFDEPIYFDNTEEMPQETVKEALVVEEPSIKEDQSSEKMIEDQHEEHMEELPASNTEEPTHEVIADLPVNFIDNPNYYDLPEEDFAVSEPRDRESQADQKSEPEKPHEEEKEHTMFEEEQQQLPVKKIPSPPKQQLEKPPGSPIEAKRKSPSRERPTEEDKKDKKPKAPPEPHRLPPAPAAPQMPYGGHMPHEAMARPPYMMDNRPPPPGVYPHAAPPMRYPYNPYPSAYPPNPYVNYSTMGAYPGMEPPNMRTGMNMNMNNPYYNYYNNPAMWNMGNRPFPYDNRAKPDGNEGDDDNLSQASDESESAKRKDKKRSKKEKKKKRKSGSRSRERSRERSKSKTRRK